MKTTVKETLIANIGIYMYFFFVFNATMLSSELNSNLKINTLKLYLNNITIFLTAVIWFFFVVLLVNAVREVVRFDCTVDVVEVRETFPVDGREVVEGEFLSTVLGLLGIDPPALFGSLFKDVTEEAGLGPADPIDDLGLGLGEIKGVDGLEEVGLSGPLKIES